MPISGEAILLLILITTIITATPLGFAGLSLLDNAKAELIRESSDFNGDRIGDLAIGVPREDIGPITDAGAVNVLYGSSTGLRASASGTTPDDQFWHQDSPGIADVAEANDWFGDSLAYADFNNDGYADLAIGAPFEDIGTITGAGAVNVIYGSSAGLSATAASDGTGRTNQFWHQDTPGVLDTAEADDNLGFALASGDFNNDGFADLALGVPEEDIGPITNAGAVNVLYGSSTGLRASAASDGTGRTNQFWHQDSPGIADLAEAYQPFGYSLASADFNNDEFDDLAIGVPFETIGTVRDAGAVNVLYGSSTGLRASAFGTTPDDQFWHQDSPGVTDIAEDNDIFGHSLATGDFNNDGFDDLAIGVAFEDIGSIVYAGAVNVLYGSATGLRASASGTTPDDQFWHQDSPGIIIQGVMRAEESDFFGDSLASADFNNDGSDDLAIGVPAENLASIMGTGVDVGGVNVLYGSSTGLRASASATTPGDQFWHQDSSEVKDPEEDNDFFGDSLASADFNNDGFDDLAIGVAFEDIGSIVNAGAVNVLYGSTTGLRASASGTTPDDQFWHQDTLGVRDLAEQYDFFSYSYVAAPEMT